MFTATTSRIAKIAAQQPGRIQELEQIFDAPTNIYIDYANIRPWSTHLGWHVDLRRLKQLLNSFSNVRTVSIYQGTLSWDAESSQLIHDLTDQGYRVITKPVKVMRISIDVTSVSADSPDILKAFIRAPLLKKFTLGTVQYLNEQLRELNRQGQTALEDWKCNFDVEIGRDMLLDYERKAAEKFVLWSGDSDFADPIRQLLSDNKPTYLFATARRVARELDALKGQGLFIYDIQKIKDFVCWPRELAPGLK